MLYRKESHFLILQLLKIKLNQSLPLWDKFYYNNYEVAQNIGQLLNLLLDGFI